MGTIRDLLLDHRVLDLGPLPAPRLPPRVSLKQALPFLARARRGAIVVVDGTSPVGILTERDVVRRVAPRIGKELETLARTTVSEVMSSPPGMIERRAPLADAVRTMADRRFRHLVVIGREGELRGMLTAADLVQYMTDQFPEETLNLPPILHQKFTRPEGG